MNNIKSRYTQEQVEELRSTAEKLLAMKYDELKANDDMRIADWFNLSEKLPEGGVITDANSEFEVIEEREKAIKVRWWFFNGHGSMESTGEGFSWEAWLPKAAIESLGGWMIKEELMHYGLWFRPSNRYQELVNFCKEHGIKGAREGLRAATLLKKVKEAGLEYAY